MRFSTSVLAVIGIVASPIATNGASFKTKSFLGLQVREKERRNQIEIETETGTKSTAT